MYGEPRAHVPERPRPGRVRRGASRLAVLTLLLVFLAPAGPTAAPVQLTSAEPNAVLNGMWTAYGDQGGHWTGGDSTASVPLPDGRIAWLFSDTFLGTVNPDHSRPSGSPMVHNALVIQRGSSLTSTLHGGTPTAPRSLVEVAGSPLQYWVADGTVESNTLRVLYNQYSTTGNGALSVQLAGTALATFSLPGLALTDLRTLPLGSSIAWGAAILEDGGYTYIYGSEHTESGTVFAHVARVPAGGLGGSWAFWSGAGWSDREADSVRLISGVGTAFSVSKVGGQYVLVSQDSNLLFNSTFVAYTASSPQGLFGPPRVLFTAPEVAPDNGRPIIVYDARVHPEFST